MTQAEAMAAPARPTVILLHGLARTHRSVAGLRRYLDRAGFSTWAASYPSRRMPLAELARITAERIRREVGEARPLVAVTHSLGGILVRHMRDGLPWRGAVMLAPPNRGSRVALAFRHHPLYRWFYGPAGQEVADGSRWPPPPEPFAVIAGVRAFGGNPLGWITRGLGLLPAGVPSDGTVAVDETRLDGMADFRTVDASHTFIMNHPEVRRLILEFLVRGRFGE